MDTPVVDIDGDMNDVAALIAADHAEIRQIFLELSRKTDTPGVRRDLVRHLVTELTAHCEAEQRTVYLTVDDELGREDAETLRRDHDQLDRLIGAVLDAPREAQQDALLADLEQVARNHMNREDAEVLPRLIERLGTKGRASLALAYSQATEAFTNVVVRPRRRAG
jgi:hemerythrin superfamily protein